MMHLARLEIPRKVSEQTITRRSDEQHGLLRELIKRRSNGIVARLLLKRRKGRGQAGVVLQAGACDGSLSASLPPRGSSGPAPSRCQRRCVSGTGDTVLTAPLQKQPPHHPTPRSPPCPAGGGGGDGVISRLYHQM